MFDWIADHQPLLYSLSAASVALFVAGIFVGPLVVTRIQPDYFAHDQRPARKWIHMAPAVRATIHMGRAFLGAVLLVTGLIMLALPGPGLVTLLVGFLLIDFPGKYRLERWLIARPFIHRPINWLRRRAGRQPLLTWSQTPQQS